MKITILRNVKLIHGEQYYDQEETLETDRISVSLIRNYTYTKHGMKQEKAIYVIIGNPFSGKDKVLTENDLMLIEDNERRKKEE